MVDGQPVSMSLQGASRAPATTKGSSIQYPGALAHVNASYNVVGDGLEEVLELQDASAQSSFQFLLKTPKGTTANQQADGSWAFALPGRAPASFWLKAPFAYDSGVKSVDPSQPHAQMSVKEVSGGFQVTLSVDAAWLHAATRRFPVFVDPTLTVQPDTLDTTFEADCGTCSGFVDAGGRMFIGVDGSHTYRQALQFDLSSIPAGVSVTSASLGVFYDQACIAVPGQFCGGVNHQVDVHQMTGPWSTTTTSSQVQFSSTVLSSFALPLSAGQEWMTWNVSSAVSGWVAGTQPNDGLYLMLSSETKNVSGPAPPGDTFQVPQLAPQLTVTYSGDSVALAQPTVLHANGAELSWSQYTGPSGAPFQQYQVHRSLTPGFTPSAATMLTSTNDLMATTFRDTTAAPGGTFYYAVVANSSKSNEAKVTLPADGQSSVSLRPGPGQDQATFMYLFDRGVNCANYGADQFLEAGADSSGVYRSLLRFDLPQIPSGATNLSAKLNLVHFLENNVPLSFHAYPVTSSWDEGTGTRSPATCTGNGATWYERTGGVQWATPGGDFDSSTASSQVSIPANETENVDSFDVSGIVSKWVSGQAPNLGLLVKADSETRGTFNFAVFAGNDYSPAATVRPQLQLTYTDGSHATLPTVSVSAPAPGAMVSGGAVTLSAAASGANPIGQVKFFVDGTAVGTASQAPWQVTWNSTSVGGGSHTVTAQATDSAGNSAVSAGAAITVNNNTPPTTAITSPASSAGGLQGTVQVTTSNTVASGLSVSKVELYVDGALTATSTAAPYSFSWNTLDPALPAYDGSAHSLTTKVYDSSGLVAASSPVSVSTNNTNGSEYAASFSTSAVPQAVSFDPSAGSQLSYPVSVTVANTSGLAWSSAGTFLHYRWYSPRPGDPVIDSGNVAALGLNPGASTTIQVSVAPPALPDGVDAAQYRLRFDVVDTTGCPSGWSCAEIGSPTPAGGQSLNTGTWTIQGGGGDIWNASDQFHFAWQPLAGDGTVSARVASQSNSDQWAKAGVMLRQSGDPASVFYDAMVTPTNGATAGNGIVIQYRNSSGAMAAMVANPPGAAPAYLRVARSGSTFSAYTSADGLTWAYVPGSALTLNVSGGMLAGLAVTSHNSAVLSTVTFDSVAISTSAPSPPTTCPSGWSCADIGSPTLAGSQGLGNGTWTIQGAGGDIWNTSDQFHFVWQSLAGDGTVSAQVASQSNSDQWAKAGVMLRQSSDPASAYYDVVATPTNGILVQYRTSAGAMATMTTSLTGAAPLYVRVDRSGSTFSAQTSADGLNWTPVAGSSVTLSLSGSMLAGLAVTSHNAAVISTAAFANVSIGAGAPPQPTTCPSGWNCAEIGGPTPAGGQSLASGTWTIQAGGGDIWNAADQFHFAWQPQPLAGDGSVSVRVASQTNSDQWAKAGVMLRQSTDPGSVYYDVVVTPSHGILYQYRSSSGAMAVGSSGGTGAAPAYVMATRTGNTFSAYTSSDGANWTLVPNSTVTIAVTGSMLAGLAVTSHNTAVLSTVVFDHAGIVPSPSPTTGGAFADKGNPPLDNPVIVNKVLKTNIGLEHFWQFTSQPVGAGITQMTNIANGNSVLSLTPLSEPGRGLSTVVDLTYNSLEEHSDSPAGNNWSLSISGLTRLGDPLDVHPNNADNIAGRSNKFIDLVDGTGRLLTFTGVTGSDGVTFWEEPAGVHLYLRQVSSDTSLQGRTWAVTRPDRVTFFYDSQGYPTAVSDKNGNTLSSTLTAVQPGDDPGGPKFHVTQVTDAGGRSFNISYFTKATAHKPQIRGKIASITDHLFDPNKPGQGRELDFAYYDDGNLLSITDRGGHNADGSPLADRSMVFTYTTSDGSGPAISDPNARVNPDPKTPNESTKIFSVRDYDGHETTFAYNGPGSSIDRWKLSSVTDRANNTTNFSYDDVNLVTTVAEPTPSGQTVRTYKYAYDVQGRPTQITDPLAGTTSLLWSPDNAVTKLTEPNNATRKFTYNDNGYPLDVIDEAGDDTRLSYQNVAVDANDVSAHWNPAGGANDTGRTIPHISQLATKLDPREVAANSGNQWSFAYDSTGNLTSVTEPLFPNNPATTTYNSDGTVASSKDFLGNQTTYLSYDANGLPTEISDATDSPTSPTHPLRMGYDTAGRMLFVQDENHASFSGGTAANYQTQFVYDTFGRMGHETTPKSTSLSLGTLVESDTTYDPNDNALATVAPHCVPVGACTNETAGSNVGTGDTTTTSYDVMDRPVLVTDPSANKTAYSYDVAGRLTQVTLPLGVVNGTPNNTHTVNYGYDALDRTIIQTQNHVNGDGSVSALNTLACYDPVGDMVSVTTPRAGLSSVSCPATTSTPFTSVYSYDAAHRLIGSTDGDGHTNGFTYDQNGNRLTATDPNNNTTSYTYDALNRLTQTSTPFITGGSPHPVVSKSVYDADGNAIQSLSPRAVDCSQVPACEPSGGTNYVTTNHYDPLNRLVRRDLPVDGAFTTQYYVHSGYDFNGNLVSTSLAATQSDPTQVPASLETVSTYLDTGWIASEQVGTEPIIHYDYNGKGQQTLRVPNTRSGSLDVANEVFWTYQPNGLLANRKDQQGQPITYQYDADGNLTLAVDASGLTDSSQTQVTTQNTYDDLDRLVRSDLKAQSATNWTFSSFAYDLNGNVTDQDQNGQEQSPGGTLVKDGHKLHTDYDAANWLTDQIDSTLNQRVLNNFTPIGLESNREIDQSNGSGGWNLLQQTSWSYFANGQLSGLTTVAPSQAPCGAPCSATTTIEKHTVSYLDPNGVYLDANRTQDVYSLRPGGTVTSPCFPGTCTATDAYDPQDRLVRNDDGHGGATAYTLDGPGNILTLSAGGTTTTNTYSGNQLQQSVTGSQTFKYWYDDLGRQQCVTDANGSQANCNPSGNTTASTDLVSDNRYDYLDRLQTYRAFSGGSQTDQATYVYDALDRQVQESEQHPSFNGDTHLTTFSYLGTSSLDVDEQQSSKNSGNVLSVKDYTYDMSGHRLAMTNTPYSNGQPGTPTTYTYGYDVHGSVSQLVDPTGKTTASYGYTPYGESDTQLSAGDTNAITPLNPFRYSAKRLDSGSGTLDMGVRRFGPDTSHFLTPDFFYGSLSNLELSTDLITGNRYDLAGGNPISFKEWDGHVALADGGGGAATDPSAPSTPAAAPAATTVARSNDGSSGGFDLLGAAKGVWQTAQKAWDGTTSAVGDKLNELRQQAQEKIDQARQEAQQKLDQVRQRVLDEAGQLKEAVQAKIKSIATAASHDVQLPRVQRPLDEPEPVEGEIPPFVLPVVLPWQAQAKARTWKCTVRCNLYPLPNCPDPAACNRQMQVDAQGPTQGDCKRAGENAIRVLAGAMRCGTRHCHVIRFWQ